MHSTHNPEAPRTTQASDLGYDADGETSDTMPMDHRQGIAAGHAAVVDGLLHTHKAPPPCLITNLDCCGVQKGILAVMRAHIPPPHTDTHTHAPSLAAQCVLQLQVLRIEPYPHPAAPWPFMRRPSWLPIPRLVPRSSSAVRTSSDLHRPSPM